MVIISFSVYDEVKGETNTESYDGEKNIEEFLRYYVKKYTDLESLDTKIYIFKSGIKVLNSKKYLSEKLGTHIQNGAQISFLRKMGLHYSINNLNPPILKNIKYF